MQDIRCQLDRVLTEVLVELERQRCASVFFVDHPVIVGFSYQNTVNKWLINTLYLLTIGPFIGNVGRRSQGDRGLRRHFL